jgi:C_GCAxxG_C_C family probable redox protein
MEILMTPEQARDKAQSLFHSGYNCAQSVFGTFCEQLGIDFDVAVKLAQPFGGGMGRMREVCGTVSGMLMALGIATGSSDAADKKAKDAEYALVQELSGRFRAQNGSIICRELLGIVPSGQPERALNAEDSAVASVQQNDIRSPVSSERTADYYKKRPCEMLCGDAAEIFQTWYIANKNAGEPQ